MTAALTACGGDSDPVTAAAAPSPTPPSSGGLVATPPASNSGGDFVEAPPPGTDGDLSAAPPTEAEGKGSTVLSWTPPTHNDDGTPLALTGYKIYWGVAEGHYPHSVTLNNPGLSRYVVEQLAAGTWYFVATALSADGESPPSNVVKMQVN